MKAVNKSCEQGCRKNCEQVNKICEKKVMNKNMNKIRGQKLLLKVGNITFVKKRCEQ